MPALAKLCLVALFIAALVPIEMGIRAFRHYARLHAETEITLTPAKIGLRAGSVRTAECR